MDGADLAMDGVVITAGGTHVMDMVMAGAGDIQAGVIIRDGVIQDGGIILLIIRDTMKELPTENVMPIIRAE